MIKLLFRQLYFKGFTYMQIMRFIIFVTVTSVIFDETYGEISRNRMNDRVSNISVRRKRGWIKDLADVTGRVLTSTVKGWSKGSSRIARWRRVFSAKRVLKSGAKFERKDGNINIYSKPGGAAQADYDFRLVDPYAIQKFEDVDGIEWVAGTVGDNVVKMAFGDNLIEVGYPLQCGEKILLTEAPVPSLKYITKEMTSGQCPKTTIFLGDCKT